MKNLSRSLAGLALALAAAVSSAQPAEKPVFSHDKAVEAATYLARQQTFATECPFSDGTKATLERLHAMALPLLGLTPDELKVIDTDTHASALELIKGDNVKEITCPPSGSSASTSNGTGSLCTSEVKAGKAVSGEARSCRRRGAKPDIALPGSWLGPCRGNGWATLSTNPGRKAASTNASGLGRGAAREYGG